MKNNNTKQLGDILRDVLKNTSYENRVWEMKLKEWWIDIVGKKISKHLIDFSLRDSKLYIRINSAVVRNELLFIRNEIKNSLNKRAGKVVVTDIIFN